MKHSKYQFYVCDWNPNGTNDLVIMSHGKQVDCLSEALFGIDVGKLGSPGRYLDPHDNSPVFRISQELLKKHVASGPFGFGFEDNCRRLSKYLKKGK